MTLSARGSGYTRHRTLLAAKCARSGRGVSKPAERRTAWAAAKGPAHPQVHVVQQERGRPMSPAQARFRFLGRGVLFGAMLAGLPFPAQADPPPGQEVTPAEASQDPDVPGFLDGLIDKELYLQLRAGALDGARRLPVHRKHVRRAGAAAGSHTSARGARLRAPPAPAPRSPRPQAWMASRCTALTRLSATASSRR